MLNDFSLNDIMLLDAALYETIDSVVFANTSKWTDKDIWIVSEKGIWIAMFLKQKLITNQKFVIKYYEIAKLLASDEDSCMMICMSVISAFLNINILRHKRDVPRTMPKHTFLFFLNKSDSIESKKQKIDISIYLEMNDNMKINEFFESCEKYYKQFNAILSD